MTKIYIFKEKNEICGFQVKGHSGYAESGQDIVCSAISAVAEMAVVGLKEVLKLKIDFKTRDGFMLVLVQENLPKAQDLLLTLQKTLQEIADRYQKFVKLEVKDYVS